jgi:hypothetical protein
VAHQDAARTHRVGDRTFTPAFIHPPPQRRNPRQGEGFASTATGIRTPVSAVRGRPRIDYGFRGCRIYGQFRRSRTSGGTLWMTPMYTSGTRERSSLATHGAAAEEGEVRDALAP